MAFRLRDLPLRRRVMLLTLLSSAIGLLVAAAALMAYAWVQSRAVAERDLGTLADMTAQNVTAAITFRDPSTATSVLSALHAKKEIDRACLFAPAPGNVPVLFAEYSSDPSAACPNTPEPDGLQGGLDALTTVVPVMLVGERIGTLVITQNLDSLRASLTAQLAITLTILGASFLVSFLIGMGMQRSLVEPILQLASVARRVSDVRDYSLRAEPGGRDELGRLIEDFNLMLHQLELRELEVQQAQDALWNEIHKKDQANEELAEALNRLRETQVQLVQAEKLASLGSLVAGLAHEINTPVGVGVTGASTLRERAQQVRKKYAEDALTRSDLERFVNLAEESTQIILKNLQRAADLVHSFKQVAVDQSSGERRTFSLRSYIDEVLLSLAPKLKKLPHRYEVECPDDLNVDTFPGAIAQILTNLVSNSLLHAFPDGKAGHIRIAVERDGRDVVLRYADDGIGIPAADLKRIFDPFFTTKRGSGGSGLGMHIVYNLVTRVLGGTIEARSTPGHGAEFVIRFPAIARKEAA